MNALTHRGVQCLRLGQLDALWAFHKRALKLPDLLSCNDDVSGELDSHTRTSSQSWPSYFRPLSDASPGREALQGLRETPSSGVFQEHQIMHRLAGRWFVLKQFL